MARRCRAFFAKSGSTKLRVAAIFSDDTFGKFFVSLAQYRRDFSDAGRSGDSRGGPAGLSASTAKPVATRALKDFPNLEVRTKAEYKSFIASQDQHVAAPVLRVARDGRGDRDLRDRADAGALGFERTREIGLLRAVGLSRRAVRAMIRWEAIIVALIGALVGLVLGLFLGTVSVAAIPEFKTIAIPWGSMVVFFVAAGIFGVLAAILPARRAARLNILAAIQSE